MGGKLAAFAKDDFVDEQLARISYGNICHLGKRLYPFHRNTLTAGVSPGYRPPATRTPVGKMSFTRRYIVVLYHPHPWPGTHLVISTFMFLRWAYDTRCSGTLRG